MLDYIAKKLSYFINDIEKKACVLPYNKKLSDSLLKLERKYNGRKNIA